MKPLLWLVLVSSLALVGLCVAHSHWLYAIWNAANAVVAVIYLAEAYER